MSPQIHFSDDFLMVVEKESGLLTVPGRTPDKSDCLLHRLQLVFPSVLVVHRLDRDTSGLVLFAKSKMAQRRLSDMFAGRSIQKEYIASVEGTVADESGTIDLRLRRDMTSSLPPRYIVDPQLGKVALTDWKVLQRGSNSSRLLLCPRTGRSHQLRVHCLAIGHPIVGDPIYGSEHAGRLRLHATMLSFEHPFTKRSVTVRSESPF